MSKADEVLQALGRSKGGNMRRTSRLLLFAFALGGLVFASGSARANIVIPLSSSLGPVPAGPGTGLAGFAYAFPDPFNQLRTLADADAFIAANSPTATFRATQVNYPRPGGTADTLGDLLGPDAATLAPASFASVSPSLVYRFLGAIAITPDLDTDPTDANIDVNFAMGSDDASRLRIGGITVLRVAGSDPTDERVSLLI